VPFVARVLGLSAGLGLAAGCAPGAGALEDGQVVSASGSLVELGLSYARDARDAAAEHWEARGVFVRYRSAERAVAPATVASLLGLTDGGGTALDACRVDDGEGSGAPGAALDIALLDAGPLAIRLHDRAGVAPRPLLSLAPQPYPELLPFVSGVVYGSDFEASSTTAEPVRPQPGALVEVEAEGGEDVGPFVAAATLPMAFPALELGGFDERGDYALRWAITPGVEPAADAAMVELRWTGATPGSLRCRVRDDGAFVAPGAMLRGLDTAVAEGALAQVTISRQHRVRVDAPGAGVGAFTVLLRERTPLGRGEP
jgi:hypothetical protein